VSTTRGRLVYSNQVVYDQADYFQSDGFTRVTGLVPAQVVSQIYYNNDLLPWSLVSGVSVADSQVVSGRVYFQAISGGPYSVRFRPNAVGFWRLLLTYPVGTQILAQSFDVQSGTGVPVPTGLKATVGGKSGC
jgi:hypothetical protein